MALRRTWIIAGLAAAALNIGGCGSGEGGDAVVAQAPESAVVVVEPTLAPDYRVVAAVLTNRDVGDARARIGGKVQRLLVRDGDDVRRGEVVAVIFDERIDFEAKAAQAAVASAAAAADRASRDLARAETLFSSQAISAAAVEAARAEARSTDAQLRSARAQADAAVALRNQGQVTAPAAGKVTRAPVPEGAVVMAGEVVVQISTGARVLRIELPESEARQLVEGAEIRILTDSDGDTPRTATIRQVYPAVEGGRVTADLDAPGFGEELVGARVRVLVPAGERTAIRVPESYIVTRYGADYVRLLRPGGAVIEAPVQRGGVSPSADMPDGVEILSGLRSGDRILPAGDAQ